MTSNSSPKSSSSAAVDEIRSFLSEMQEKSPEEVLGLPTTSQLPRLTVLAALATLVLLVVTTGGMYGLRLMRGTPLVATPAKAAAEPAAASVAEPATQSSAEATTPAIPEDTNHDTVDPDAAIQAMGIGESKEADADANPLESGIDDLLKGLE